MHMTSGCVYVYRPRSKSMGLCTVCSPLRAVSSVSSF